MAISELTVETGHHLVFVYGTLKRGHANHFLLNRERCLGEASTLKKYRMFCNGAYPMIVPDSKKGYFITGELFEVPSVKLGKLDALEGHPHLYMRDAVPVQLDGTEFRATAYGYIWTRPTEGLVEITSGMWTPPSARNRQ